MNMWEETVNTLLLLTPAQITEEDDQERGDYQLARRVRRFGQY